MTILAVVLAYFLVLLSVSRLTAGRKATNEAFYRANRRAPWYMVAFGMVGASISGVTFVSVPGMVLSSDMAYMQTCLGFILGYFVVAFVLLPVYYRLNLTTIYTYLRDRIGRRAHTTGAAFFLLSKMTGAAVRFYVVCIILQRFVLGPTPDPSLKGGETWTGVGLGIPFWITVPLMVCLIWLYTRRGGIKTRVWTDTFQTVCMFATLILIIYKVTGELGYSLPDAVEAIKGDARSRMFVFDDWHSKWFFWKQFLSGMFITIVMTGLDQDMMQKNMTCRTLRDAQKDMCTYGFAFAPANLLFMCLGILLAQLAARQGLSLPASGDELLPMFAATGRLGRAALMLFIVGIVAASFSSADSALTSLTTSYCVDLRGRAGDERLRKRAHVGVAVVFAVFILLFRLLNSTSVIDAIYVMCGYTYGPLLGLFAFGLFTKRRTNDRLVPYVCVASPLLCFLLDKTIASATGYHFGYELLMLNGLLTYLGLWLSGAGKNANKS